MTRLDCGLHASGQGVSPIHFFIALLMVLENCKTFGLPHEPETLLQDPPQYEVVHPTRVDAKGHFLSNILSHHARRVQRREASEGPADLDRVFYQFWHADHSLHFNLTLNPHLLAPGFLTERRYGGFEEAQIRPTGSSQCHFLGEVWDEDSVKGSAAISTCDGLTGLFKLSDEEFFIQPLEKLNDETSAPQAHAIYKRHASPSSLTPYVQHISGKQALNGTCGNKNSRQSFEDIERQREKWEHRQQRRRRRIRQRSVSKEKWVETLVVADPKMVEYHGSKAAESYVLAVMNIVAGLFRDASIGNAINIVVVRLILMEQDEQTADHRPQTPQSVNATPQSTTDLMQRTAGDEKEGATISSAFGIQHDGNGNDCEPIGKRPFVMSPQLLYGTSLPRWSRCSRQYITRFLDRGWGWCLDDPPVKEKLSLNLVLPGVLYSAAHQCRLQYGSGSVLCDDMDWCFGGECVAAGYQPESVNGGWAPWSEWSACSRTCGAGVQNAHRDCDNPVPKYRGKYCLGERRRYKTCNTTPCPHDVPTFRDIQCSHFNTMPYKGKFYKWETVISRVSPCELHCRPVNEHFAEKMLDAVIDGTPCYEGNKSRNMCINGICQNVGCDFVIESNAVEDRCGVCNGNGSTCTTVRRMFEESEGTRYFVFFSYIKYPLGYVDIGLIPEGAWGIHIEEVAEAGNFLALRSDNPNKYFLNGGWTIQWNGEYKAAGTVFTYERTGQLENLTSPGPTMEPLWIQLLFQETNPGVRYEYTINQNDFEDNNILASVFFWKYGSWTECSVTCGTGVQKQIVHCVEKTTGIVEEQFCDPLTRPDNNQTSCNKDPCPAIWWVGEWQKCSASCGSTGQTKRTVLCIQAVSVEEQKALQSSECEHIPKPESLSSCNTHIPCPADWTAGGWSKCSVTCGSGARRRNVTCSRNTGIDCDPQKKPVAVATCHNQDCPQVVDNFGIDWSGSGWSSKEVLNEINSIPEVKPPPKYSTTRAQPRNHHDLNDIVEGDFHYHNNIENINSSPENGVEVDDFYYDYNFINFHEDLSDDFESDGKDSEDSSKFDAPQEAKPTHSVEKNAHTETTRAPTATSAIPMISKATASTLKTEEPVNTNLNNMRDSGNVATKESIHLNSENLDDFLSEDFLLPVSTTRSPPLSTTQHSQTVKERENISTMLFTTKEPTQDVKWEEHEEAENNYDNFFEEDGLTEDVTMTPKHAAPTPRHQTTINTFVATTVNVQESEEQHYYDYNYNEKVPDISTNQEDVESPEPLGSPTPEKIIQVKPKVELDESAAEIPQTTSQPTIFPAASTLDQTHFDTVYTTSQYLQDTDLQYLSTTSFPASEKSAPLPVPFMIISGNEKASDSKSLTGTEIIPPATLKQEPTKPAFTEKTGTDPTSQAPWFDLADFDYNEIVVPTMMSSHDSDPEPSYQLPTNTAATSQRSATPAQHVDTTTPPVTILPIHPPTPWLLPVPASVQTSASTQVTKTAYWVTGNWSACSKNCEGGIKLREVQCFDMRDQRPLRPFHCRAMSSRPPTQMTCNLQPCLKWYTSSWGQRRLIKCINTKAETDEEVDQAQCDHEPQPESSQKCNLQDCMSAPSGLFTVVLIDRPVTVYACHREYGVKCQRRAITKTFNMIQGSDSREVQQKASQINIRRRCNLQNTQSHAFVRACEVKASSKDLLDSNLFTEAAVIQNVK
ncbi:disintegrin and metalloproteinase with thrombospondin motifs 7 [Collichthys lucidus]|uniref:Disintegrin and metalloproteinase with thrombospondin motifs 7 n=1 Tax=Collichthys lucidus TaxID=240159 RepID=A0A4U5U6W4_COLLU|nr:disintegrin and metalloproteinase with thrombospondin motifs 7 [Collichthys lucidus]